MDLLEVELDVKDEYKIRETLTRIGVLSSNRNELFQSCHLFKKAGKFYLVHFKEMFIQNGKTADFTMNDKIRRDTIAFLLEKWNLIRILNKDDLQVSQDKITVIPHKEKYNFILTPMYHFNKKNDLIWKERWKEGWRKKE